MRRPLPWAFYFNAVAMGLFFAAVLLRSHRFATVLQWAASGAVACAVALLVIRK